jgi:hypothetical protein
MLYTFTLWFLTSVIGWRSWGCRDVPWHVWKLGKQRRLATIPVSLLWLDFEVGVSSISGLSSIVYRSWQFHQVMNPER